MLFKRLREELEHEIRIGRKKRIFEPNEEIRLKATTVKEVVRHLEHHDLYGIDEDLNGRLFETFLSSTMRGPELGQFFTPRSIVEFMSDLVDLQVSLQHVDLIGDLCCGTGGFLIEAMASLAEKATVFGSFYIPSNVKFAKLLHCSPPFTIVLSVGLMIIHTLKNPSSSLLNQYLPV